METLGLQVLPAIIFLALEMEIRYPPVKREC